jgi:hypothetical protein
MRMKAIQSLMAVEGASPVVPEETPKAKSSDNQRKLRELLAEMPSRMPGTVLPGASVAPEQLWLGRCTRKTRPA